MLTDNFKRKIDYLRISVTDRCDLRCTYCMAEDVTFLPRQEVLSIEEIIKLTNIFNELGVKKFRLTGGEPLVRKNIVSIIEHLNNLKNQGKIFQVDNEYWIHESSKKSLLQQLLKYFANQETLSVSDFKSITSTTRKNAIPLLEFCDKNNFTQREGNLRVKGDCLHDQ